MTIIRFADLTPVPWKNGKGITREIAVEPPGASMDDFLWRVSIADVDSASPFSTFPGIDRTIVLLEGDGFTMTLDGEREHALTTPYAPFAFAGEAHVDVKLAGGATRDFNLMVRRGVATGTVEVAHGPLDWSSDDESVLVYICQGFALVDRIPCNEGDSIIGTSNVSLKHGSAVIFVRISKQSAGRSHIHEA